MSVHFSIDELFQAIEKNDIVALEKAIFFLGANIHRVGVCEDLTPMLYAARLGHFEQVKILLADMKRYVDEDSEFVLVKNVRTIEHAIPNRHKDKDFLLELSDATGEHLDMRRIFEERAFDFLEAILEKDSDRYIREIVEGFTSESLTLTHVYSRGLFQLSDKARRHPLLASELNQVREKDPLYYAAMANDAEEMKRILPEFFRTPKRFPRCTRTFSRISRKPRPHFPLCMEGYWELMKLVIEKDDVSLFNALMNGNMAETLRVTGLTEEQLYFNIFMDSLNCSSINIINHVLSLEKPSQKHIRETDWWLRYFLLKLQGKVKSAEAVKAFCELGITDKAEVLSIIINCFTETDGVSKDILIETFDEIEEFIRKTSDHAEMLTRLSSFLRDFPKTSERTDLVEPLTKYGVEYSQTDVIVQMNKDIDFDRFNEPVNECLAGGRHQVAVSSLRPSLSACALIMECAEQLGGSIDAYIEPPWSMEDRKSYERAKREHVASVPSLQKQCRLTIREAIHTSNPVRPTDAMLSLFVNKYLPKTLVNYLLFRDEDVHRPLHYLLVNLEDSDNSDDSESEVVCSDSSEEYYYETDEMNGMNYQRLMLELMAFND